MKETGIVRKIDRMGRVVLPKELRWKYKIDCGDLVEIFTDGEGIYLKKFKAESDFMNQIGELYRTVENMEKELQNTKELQGDLKNIRQKLEKLHEEEE